MVRSNTAKTATVSEKHPFVAEPTTALQEAVEGAEVGDGFEVAYIGSNGTRSTSRGTVTEVNPRFGDVRFDTANGEAYLHVNTRTGDYYFSDEYPASPADGYRIIRVNLRPRSN